MDKKLLFILTGSILTLSFLVFFAMTSWDDFINKKTLQSVTQNDEIHTTTGVTTTSSQDDEIRTTTEVTTTSSTASPENSPFCIMDPPISQPKIGQWNWNYYKDLGVKWMELVAENERTGWQSIEKEKSKYDFSASDEEVCGFYSRGINVIYVTRPINSLYGTNWREGSPANNEYPSGYLNEWGNFIKALVERYDGDGQDDGSCSEKIKVKYFQVVHELAPLEFGGDYWQKNPSQYAEIFETAYKSMKESCASCVLAMPVSPPDEIKKENNFTVTVLAKLKNKGVKDIAFDYHYWDEYTWRPEYIKKIKEIASQYGFDTSKIKILSNESGTPAIGDDGEAKQANYLVRSYVTSISHGQTKQCWSRIYDYTGGAEIWKNIGLVKNPANGSQEYKKLAYYSYKQLIEKLDGSDWNNIQTIQEKDSIYIYKFTKNSKPIWVAWNDNSGSKTITLDVESINSVKITEAVPKYDSGEKVIEYNTAFDTETRSVSGGKATITLGENPIFIEKN